MNGCLCSRMASAALGCENPSPIFGSPWSRPGKCVYRRGMGRVVAQMHGSTGTRSSTMQEKCEKAKRLNTLKVPPSAPVACGREAGNQHNTVPSQSAMGVWMSLGLRHTLTKPTLHHKKGAVAGPLEACHAGVLSAGSGKSASVDGDNNNARDNDDVYEYGNNNGDDDDGSGDNVDRHTPTRWTNDTTQHNTKQGRRKRQRNDDATTQRRRNDDATTTQRRNDANDDANDNANDDANDIATTQRRKRRRKRRRQRQRNDANDDNDDTTAKSPLVVGRWLFVLRRRWFVCSLQLRNVSSAKRQSLTATHCHSLAY